MRALDRVNQRYPWDHNEHFHGWILHNLPARRRHALDIGCGTGLLVSRLTAAFDRVTGIDADPRMVGAARERLATNPRATVHPRDAAELGHGLSGVPPEGFDLITMVAVLHHLDLRSTLERVPGLLAPGGRLLVVGLARPGTASDVAVDAVSAVVNPVIGLVRHLRDGRSRPEADGPAVPVRDPATTLAEIEDASRVFLPGAVCRRRLFFRYTLQWTKPA